MKCQIVSYIVPEGPPLYAGISYGKAVLKCETHNWMIEGVAVDGLCPIGRIEQATESAITRIHALQDPK